jgi:hypothetical protein
LKIYAGIVPTEALSLSPVLRLGMELDGKKKEKKKRKEIS